MVYNGCNYLSMLGFKLTHNIKRGPNAHYSSRLVPVLWNVGVCRASHSFYKAFFQHNMVITQFDLASLFVVVEAQSTKRNKTNIGVGITESPSPVTLFSSIS